MGFKLKLTVEVKQIIFALYVPVTEINTYDYDQQQC